MSQWQVPTAEPALLTMNVNIIYLLLGLYGWEYIMTLDVEFAVVRGRSSFRWSLIPYIIGRTSLVLFLILLAVGTSPFPEEIACLPSIVLTSMTGVVALGCSSTIFTIRTWVIWKDSRLMHVVLLVLSLGLWTMLIIDVTSIKPIEENGTCIVYVNYPQVNGATLIYTTCYDLLVFVLSVVGLSRQRCESPLKQRLRTQGILYFAVAGIAYLLPMIFSLLGLTLLMMMFSNIAATTSVIVSSRAVRSLLSLDPSKSSRTQDSNIPLTSQIAIQPSMTQESSRGVFVDQADSC